MAKVIEGVNDLATIRPDLLEFWCYEKNNELGIFLNKVGLGSHKKVYWICSKCKIPYEQIISKRVQKDSVCGVCKNSKTVIGVNDITTTHPHLLEYWDYENNILEPFYFQYGSKKKFFWKCIKCGEPFEQSINNRIRSTGICPVCQGKEVVPGVNDLASNKPDLLQFWDYKKNNELGIYPESVTIGSNKMAYWICEKCNESYKQSIAERVKKTGICEVCWNRVVRVGYNDLATTHPDVVKLWDWEKNNDLGLYPIDFTAGSEKKVWWACEKGHHYEMDIYSKVNRSKGCPVCNRGKTTSYPEQYLYLCFSDIFKNVHSRYKINGIEVDVYIEDLNIGIEYDGLYYHSLRVKEDKLKEKKLKDLGLTLIRIKECDEKKKIFDIINGDYFYNYTSHHKTNAKVLNEIIMDIISRINVFYCANYNFSPPDFSDINIKVLERIQVYKREQSFAIKKPELLDEWDYDKNVNIDPYGVSYGSNQIYWWKCKEGHSYERSVTEKMRGLGCPYCSKHRVLSEFNSLGIKYPEVLKYWDYEKNDISPFEIAPNSQHKCYWICEKGHSWQARPNTIKKSLTCPVCVGQIVQKGVNDLATLRSDVLSEWDYEKNTILPTEVTVGSGKKVWWRCPEGHSYETFIYNKPGKKKYKCPICSGRKLEIGVNDLETVYPDVLIDWDYNKNTISPKEVYCHSNKKVHWKCHKCGKEWQGTVENQVRRKTYGCVECGQKYNLKKSLKKKSENPTVI